MTQQDPVQQALEAYRDACVALQESLSGECADSGPYVILSQHKAFGLSVKAAFTLKQAREAAARASEDEEAIRCLTNGWPRLNTSPTCVSNVALSDRMAREAIAALKAAGFEVRRASKP